MDNEGESDSPWAEAPEGAVFRVEDLSQAGPPPADRHRFPILAVLGVLAVLAVIGALALGAFGARMTGNGVATTTDQTQPAATEVPSSPPSTSALTHSPTPTTATEEASLPGGLFCRDLEARDIRYPQAVAYWRSEGRPSRMDADRNDIPCETVYSREDVLAYWGEIGWDSAGGYLGSLPSGLYCRDLNARGFDYGEAVAYWLSQGMPDRMDEDSNGIPCETIYDQAAVSRYWSER